MVIQTGMLTLRRWREEDIEPLSIINADHSVMKWLGTGPIDSERTAQYIHRNNTFFDTHGFGIWAMELRAERRLVGFAGVRPFERMGHPCSPCVEAAWRLARDAWGRGYATEAAQAAIADVFDRGIISEVLAWAPAINIRSQAVMRRLQMKRRRDSDFDAPSLPAEHPLRPHVVFGLRRPDSATS